MRRGDYIRGSFVKPEMVDGYIIGVNPGDREDVLGRFLFSETSVESCVLGASRAVPVWRSKSLAERCGAIRKVREYLNARQDSIAVLITRETGKPLWEAQQEVLAAVRALDLVLDDGLALLSTKVLDAREARSERLARGVVGIVTPYNMPLLLPVFQVSCAMLAGNTVVFKPSKFAPGTGQVLAEAMDRCRLPRGAFNLFQGSGAGNGSKLVSHPQLDALLFSGSYRTGQLISKATQARPELPVFMQCGGKGCAIVVEGCDMKRAVYETVISSFMTAGQRHNSTSRVIVTKDVFDEFCKRLVRRTGLLQIGYGLERETFMGPVISDLMRKRYFKYCRALQNKGHSPLVSAADVDCGRRGFYVHPAIYWVHWEKGAPFLNDEPPGPTLLLYRVDTWEEAVALHNRLNYRVATSLFVDPEHEYLGEMKSRISTGTLNVNRGTIGSSIRLPATGLGRSSNGIVGGLELLRFLSSPRAVLEDVRPFDPRNALPGMHWMDTSEEPTDMGAAPQDTEIQ